MTAYAVAQLHDVDMNADIVEYLERIDATMEPFGGRFIIHGGETEPLEGSWRPQTLIVIEFPDRDSLWAWYRSPAYQEILPLRTRNPSCDAVIVEGVDEDHRATDVLAG
ncbi:DUF1330 domain-containing protein [Microbispora sp. NPDC088329]|uniref:DUF1330 domain-containing protein n=1 Tax=Microbispora sp. NPDC088329 TaxID=3154869 RepID=UPI003445806F